MGTTAWWQADWVWVGTGRVLCALGVGVLVWALFWDRARGRRRCPGCWYEMTGVPGLRCPECGREAKREKGLFATRRWWGRAVFGAMMLVLGYAAFEFPAWSRGGWVRVVPSTYLAYFGPVDAPPPPAARPRAWTLAGIGAMPLGGLPSGRTGVPGAVAAPMPKPTAREMMSEEVWRRVESGEMWGYECRAMARRAVEPMRARWERQIDVPARWPAGAPLPAVVRSTLFLPGRLDLVGAADPDKPGWAGQSAMWIRAEGEAGEKARVRVQFWAQRRMMYETVAATKCLLIADAKEIFQTDDSEAATAVALRALDPRACINSAGEITIAMDDRGKSARWQVGMGLGCRVEVLVNGKTAGTAVYAPEWLREVFKNWHELSVEWQPGMRKEAARNPGAVRIRVTGDATQSAVSMGGWVFSESKPRCWTGSFEIPARVVARPETFEEPRER